MKTLIVTSAIVVGLITSGNVVAGGDAAAGQTKSQVCASCHGADGNSTDPTFPKLGGQHADYLVQTLKDYKSGERQNPIMSGFVGNLTEQDMEDLAAYYSSQDGLHTPTDY